MTEFEINDILDSLSGENPDPIRQALVHRAILQHEVAQRWSAEYVSRRRKGPASGPVTPAPRRSSWSFRLAESPLGMAAETAKEVPAPRNQLIEGVRVDPTAGILELRLPANEVPLGIVKIELKDSKVSGQVTALLVLEPTAAGPEAKNQVEMRTGFVELVDLCQGARLTNPTVELFPADLNNPDGLQNFSRKDIEPLLEHPLALRHAELRSNVQALLERL
ncbi:MAG: hypothetical protein K1X74_17230 [Pirellulales bacterium]|nr:hypothetical protein [Pirellulales bacterium]